MGTTACAHRSGRVVRRGQVGAQQRLAREAVHEPQVLVGRDVRQVPHERAHDGVDLALEVGRREVADQVERAAPGRVQCVEGFSHQA